MEAMIKGDFGMNLPNILLLEAKPFTARREINWFRVKVASGGLILLLIVTLLFLPSGEVEQRSFHEKTGKGGVVSNYGIESDPTQETLNQIQESQAGMRQVHDSLDHLYRPDTPSGSGGGSPGVSDKNSSMILTRGGNDSRSQLSAGTKLSVKLSTGMTISNQPMPVTGIVAKDVLAESGVAIPSGSKLLGDASFDEGNERATIQWRAIILPGGRERPFSAIGVGRDGQVGVEGIVHSDGVKNAVGQTLTRFVGAYAAGSMNTGVFGANQGGHKNGLRNAVAQTATDQANDMGEEMQKERKWIELRGGTETTAVINQSYTFRDAGAFYGQ